MPSAVARTYSVAGMTCDHCRSAVTEALERVDGVESVGVDLEAKLVTVRGAEVDDVAVRTAIVQAGYEAAP